MTAKARSEASVRRCYSTGAASSIRRAYSRSWGENGRWCSTFQIDPVVVNAGELVLDEGRLAVEIRYGRWRVTRETVCRRVWLPADAERWRCYLDTEDNRVFYCQECAEREFDD